MTNTKQAENVPCFVGRDLCKHSLEKVHEFLLLSRRQRARRRFASRECDIVEELDVGGGDNGRGVRGHDAERNGRIVHGGTVVVGNNESSRGERVIS